MTTKVKVVSYSAPSKELFDGGIHDCQDLISYCARVSNPSNQMNTQTSERLLNYLAKHKHWSPFEMVNVCLEIETTRDIGRQILRHRSFTFQEFSQRYADPTKDFAFAIREPRLQDSKNRQNSIPIDTEDPRQVKAAYMWERMQENLISTVSKYYEWAIDNGIAKEQARALLPEGLTMSRMYVNGTLRSWIHYCELRSSNGTQAEHMEIAKECAKVIAEVFPLIKDYTSW